MRTVSGRITFKAASSDGTSTSLFARLWTASTSTHTHTPHSTLPCMIYLSTCVAATLRRLLVLLTLNVLYAINMICFEGTQLPTQKQQGRSHLANVIYVVDHLTTDLTCVFMHSMHSKLTQYNLVARDMFAWYNFTKCLGSRVALWTNQIEERIARIKFLQESAKCDSACTLPGGPHQSIDCCLFVCGWMSALHQLLTTESCMCEHTRKWCELTLRLLPIML